MKNIILTLLFVVMSLSINSQILQTEASTTAGSSSMAFIDGSSAFNYNAFNGAGKGILFPSTDLTNINAADVFDSGTVGTSTYNPNYYDGLVVYNTGTGSVIGEMGTGSPDVAPGFYYYANPNRTAWDGGTWTPLGGGATNTPTPTFEGVTETDVNLSNPLVEAPVITTETTTSIFTFVNTRTRESGYKTTQINSGVTSGLLPNDVIEFRGAKIFDDITGDLVFTGGTNYNKTTNVFTTGNGMINYSLPEGNYRVDIRFSSTTLLQDPVPGP